MGANQSRVNSNFKMVVQGKPLYFSPQMMAKLSPYFARICYDDYFNLKKAVEVVITDEKYSDMKEMFDILSSVKSISGENRATMFRLADRFHIILLAKMVMKYDGERSPEQMFEMRRAAEQVMINRAKFIIREATTYEPEWDFTKESRFASFKLTIEDQSLFISPQLMAEISTYFAKICYDDNFKEKEAKEVIITDVKYEEVKEMLEAVGPAPCRPISANNSAAMLKLADRFDIPSLAKSVLRFINGSEFQMTNFSDETRAIQLLKVAEDVNLLNIDPLAMTRIINLVSEIDMDKLNEAGVSLAKSRSKALFTSLTQFTALDENRDFDDSAATFLFTHVPPHDLSPPN